MSAADFSPIHPECEDCGTSCHPYEVGNKPDFHQWEESRTCRECAESSFNSEQKEFRSMPL